MGANSYLVPDYYPNFKCKGGECTHTCCSGWRITISMRKYFELLGLLCSKELRCRLDRAFCICERPTPERYAQIVPTWDGDCPVHNEKGLCALQVECGEEVLTEACRYYPRSMRSEYRHECSCSNSCEGVVEMLLFRTEPIKFMCMELSFCRDDDPVEFRHTAKARQHNAVRDASIRLLQDRSRPFPERMIRLGSFIERISGITEPGIDIPDESLSEEYTYPADDIYAITILHNLIGWFEENKPECAAHEYFTEAQNYLGIEGAAELDEAAASAAAEKYHAARVDFRQAYPDFSTMSEQILVNHVFYSGFPYADPRNSLWEDYMALCAVYAFARLLKTCCYMSGGGDKKLVDVIAAAFRLIEHSVFDRNAAILLKKADCNTPEKLAALLLI